MNAYFICVIVRVQMWFMYAQLLDDQTQKDFLSVSCVSGSDFCHFGYLKFFLKCQFF